ncbi:WD repeat-containing protein 13 isoform X2 [Harpegnathos saltator]|uniref:WD repeat-containing protein 13 n=1 Tax=Harpegnathos saltator TaxID=610380 RepID=E2BKB4_HARSA|nr:WD repeat-containing protein 13 isoform X2 [Harpegnathos saltator]EFN83867.1 WD repeat-containing protein 13 [Harpegnathos saltator]
MATMWHQQIFALDAKYNTLRATKLSSLGMLYIRRRNQLLREKFSRDLEIVTQYLKLRSKLLCRRYGDCQEQNSIGSHTINEESLEKKMKHHTIQRKSTAENFAFAGVHHVFDQHKTAVSMLKFANNDRSKLCCASLDGTLSICEVISTPPKVIALLEGHHNGVTALDWSICNDLIVSSSLDATIRLWRVCVDMEPSCLRVVNDQQRAEVLCCSFIPANNNLIIAGNSQGLIQILNVSTGIYTRGGSCKIGGKILSLTCEGSGGSIIWAGNDRGVIVSFRLEPGIGRLTKLQRVLETGSMITSLSWRSWLSKDAPWAALLINSACNMVLLYHVVDSHGSLCFWRKYPIKHRYYSLRSTFCPQMGACLIATGSEDGAVHLLDCAREGKSARINRLHGHATSTITLSFNYDESLLASADHDGLVILWRNHQRHL